MWRIVKYLILCFGISLVSLDQAFSQDEIEIHNTKPGMDFKRIITDFNVGSTQPQYNINTGNILNVHYFPGLLYYSKGYYTSALTEMQYFIDRPEYTKNHARHSNFFSIAHYICGMIYFYHDSGRGRYIRAKESFEQSIQWNPENHLAYLEISRVLSAIELKEKAVSILQHLLELKPKEDVAQQARKELVLLQSEKSK